MEGHPTHEESILDSPIVILIGDNIGALVGVHTQVEEFGYTEAVERFVPDLKSPGLFHLAEHCLPVVVSERDDNAVVVIVMQIRCEGSSVAGPSDTGADCSHQGVP